MVTQDMDLNPDDRLYTPAHVWVQLEEAACLVGITYHAQDELGDLVYVDLPDIDSHVSASGYLAAVESGKTVSDVVAPVAGRVTEVNSRLEAEPTLVNEDPYGAGWLCRIALSGEIDRTQYLSAQSYEQMVKDK